MDGLFGWLLGLSAVSLDRLTVSTLTTYRITKKGEIKQDVNFKFGASFFKYLDKIY